MSMGVLSFGRLFSKIFPNIFRLCSTFFSSYAGSDSASGRSRICLGSSNLTFQESADSRIFLINPKLSLRPVSLTDWHCAL